MLELLPALAPWLVVMALTTASIAAVAGWLLDCIEPWVDRLDACVWRKDKNA